MNGVLQQLLSIMLVVFMVSNLLEVGLSLQLDYTHSSLEAVFPMGYVVQNICAKQWTFDDLRLCTGKH
jgi:hypothetical protein